MATKRARKSRATHQEPLTAPLGEIAHTVAPRAKEVEEKAESFLQSALTWANETVTAGKSFLRRNGLQAGLAGFGAGLALVAVALKRRRAS